MSTLAALCERVAERAGARLSRPQRQRLEREIERRLDGRSPADYLTSLPPHEVDALASVLSVLKSELFREPDQLDVILDQVLRPLAASARPLRLWSAGCATGEEVATLLVLLAEAGAHSGSTVLGTDLSDPALAAARELCFSTRRMAAVPPALRRRWFVSAGPRGEAVLPALRSRASFARHNLMDEPYPTAPDGQPFDVIFCRNVLIYLHDDAAERVVRGLTASLAPDGVLVLSRAEPLLRPVVGLTRQSLGEALVWRRARTGTGYFLAASATPVLAKPAPPAAAARSPRARAEDLFQALLEAPDTAPDRMGGAEAEATLHECVVLDPTFAQARYLLALLLERRGAGEEARPHLVEAVRSLEAGRSPFPFFLNDARLRQACEAVLARIDRRRAG